MLCSPPKCILLYRRPASCFPWFPSSATDTIRWCSSFWCWVLLDWVPREVQYSLIMAVLRCVEDQERNRREEGGSVSIPMPWRAFKSMQTYIPGQTAAAVTRQWYWCSGYCSIGPAYIARPARAYSLPLPPGALSVCTLGTLCSAWR